MRHEVRRLLGNANDNLPTQQIHNHIARVSVWMEPSKHTDGISGTCVFIGTPPSAAALSLMDDPECGARQQRSSHLTIWAGEVDLYSGSVTVNALDKGVVEFVLIVLWWVTSATSVFRAFKRSSPAYQVGGTTRGWRESPSLSIARLALEARVFNKKFSVGRTLAASARGSSRTGPPG